MSWDSVSVVTMAAFGVASLVLSQTRDLLSKAVGVVRAWRELRKEIDKH